MAHLHFKRTAYRSGGNAASQRLEYITRQPGYDLSPAERQLRYVREGREDLVYERTKNLPAWAANAQEFFKAAEQYERKGGVAFEEWKMTLPHECTRAQNMALMRDLVDAIAGERLPVTYAFHDPSTMDNARQQPHLHVLISSRQNDTHTRTPAQHFQRWNAQHPERGGAHKDRTFAHMGAMKAHRVLIADIVNAHLERHGHAVRIHPDRLEDRDIARQPEPKLLPSESREYRDKGIISARMQQVLDIRAERAQQLAREQHNARTYWESRKAELGMTRDMAMTEKLARMTEARTHRATHAPERPSLEHLRAQERELTESMKGLEKHVADLQHFARREHRIESQRMARDWRQELAAERVLAAGATHGLPRDREAEQTVARHERAARLRTTAQQLRKLAQGLDRDEPQAGAGLRVRLHDREEERERDGYGRGYGW